MLFHSLLHFQGSVDSTDGVVLVGARRAEEDDEAVAHGILVHARNRALVFFDDVGHFDEVVVEVLGDQFGILLAEGIHQIADAQVVGKHDRDLTPVGRNARVAGVVNDAADQFAIHVGGQALHSLDQVGNLGGRLAFGRFLQGEALLFPSQGGRGYEPVDAFGLLAVLAFGLHRRGLRPGADQIVDFLGEGDLAAGGIALADFGAVDRVPGGDVSHGAALAFFRLGRGADVGGEVGAGGNATFDLERAFFTGGIDLGVFFHHLLDGQAGLGRQERAFGHLLGGVAGEDAQHGVSAELEQVAAMIEQGGDHIEEQVVDNFSDALGSSLWRYHLQALGERGEAGNVAEDEHTPLEAAFGYAGGLGFYDHRAGQVSFGGVEQGGQVVAGRVQVGGGGDALHGLVERGGQEALEVGE